MHKLLNKGAVGVVIYVQTLQLEPNSESSTPKLTQILSDFDDIF
jgi:hypothetical protein